MDPISAIINVASTLLSRVWPDKSEAQKQEFLLAFHKLLSETELAKAQLNVNANEALHTSLFVAGWRPWIGWGFGTLTMVYILATTIFNICVAYGCHIQPLPPLDPMVRDVIMGMLGITVTARTFEKVKGVKR